MIEDKYEVINELIREYQEKKNQVLLFQILDFYKPLFLSSVKRCIQKDNRLSFCPSNIINRREKIKVYLNRHCF